MRMLIASIFGGLLSIMSVWADKASDIYLSINDVYMVGMMTGWMFFFMGLLDRNWSGAIISGVVALGFVWAARTQFLVDRTQYLRGMIPHHSMAVLMNKRQDPAAWRDTATPRHFLEDMTRTQEREIETMKEMLRPHTEHQEEEHRSCASTVIFS